MTPVGVGVVTGLHAAQSIEAAVILDSRGVYDAAKKSVEEASTEREGYAGARAITGTFKGRRVALVQVPPYPQAVAEAAVELYLLGARSIILVGRGYRISKRVPADAAVLAWGAVSRDSVSQRIAPRGAPLTPSEHLYSRIRSVAESRELEFDVVQGLTVTLDSVRLRHALEEAEDLVGARGAVAVDSLVAPLYAMRYEYQNLEAAALVTAYRQYERVPFLIEASPDAYARLAEKEYKAQVMLLTTALEAIAAEAGEA